MRPPKWKRELDERLAAEKADLEATVVVYAFTVHVVSPADDVELGHRDQVVSVKVLDSGLAEVVVARRVRERKV